MPCLFDITSFFPLDRALQPEGLHHSRGMAASEFPPLRKIPHCCLPEESGPCLSPSVADHPLRPATHRRLGEPLPHQLSNGTRTHPHAHGSEESHAFPTHPFDSWAYPVLAVLSVCYPGHEGRLFTCYSPVRRFTQDRSPFHARLACVRPAASVRSEPGSNSPV